MRTLSQTAEARVARFRRRGELPGVPASWRHRPGRAPSLVKSDTGLALEGRNGHSRRHLPPADLSSNFTQMDEVHQPLHRTRAAPNESSYFDRCRLRWPVGRIEYTKNRGGLCGNQAMGTATIASDRTRTGLPSDPQARLIVARPRLILTMVIATRLGRLSGAHRKNPDARPLSGRFASQYRRGH